MGLKHQFFKFNQIMDKKKEAKSAPLLLIDVLLNTNLTVPKNIIFVGDQLF